MSMYEYELGTVTYNGNGLFVWDLGKDFVSLTRSINVVFNSPRFSFAGARWLLSVCPDYRKNGWLDLSFRNEIRSSTPRLFVNLDIHTSYGMKENYRGETSFFGDFSVRPWLRLQDRERSMTEFAPNECFIIFCKLQRCNTAPNESLLPESLPSVVLNSNPEKEESKEEDKSRLFKSVALNSKPEKEESKEEDKSRLLKNLLSLSDNFKQLFQSGERYDVTLIVKGKQLQAHSAILQARSIVFSSMMTHDMVEKSSREVRIDDCEPGAIQELLHFVYTGKVENLTEDNMQHVYYAADKYEVADLKSECVEFMKTSLTTKVVCEVIVLAAMHDEPDLLACATEYFIKNIDEVLETVQWRNFLQEYPTEANELYIKALKTIRT